MKKVVVLLAVVVSAVVSYSQPYYPDYAYPTGYQMIQGEKAMWQNIAEMANWWGSKRGKITDTCPVTVSTKWGGDTLALYGIRNYSATNILLKYLGNNNRTDTIPIVIPAGSSCSKVPRIWKIVSTSVTSSTLDSLTFDFQWMKRVDF